MKKSGITLLFVFFSFFGRSQSNLDFLLNRFEINSINYNNTNRAIFDVENQSLYTLRENPAFMHWYCSNLNKKYHSSPQTAIISSLNYTNVEGDYIPFDGNKTLEGDILAGGKKTRLGVGTLYGIVFYGVKEREKTFLNYAVNPQNYSPYFVSDTLGMSKKKDEKYLIKGGFGFRHKGLFYGIGGLYQGTASSKLTDPRLSVYDAWFRLNFGVALTHKNKLFALNLFPELNRQSISASTHLQRTTKYLQFYGFGAWNRQESLAGNVHKSLYTIKGLGAGLSIRKLQNTNSKFLYSMNLSYNFRRMKSETIDSKRGSYKNLFSSSIHYINPEITFTLNNYSFTHYLLLTGTNYYKIGTEHVYENTKVSHTQDLYDYIKVSSKKMYHQYFFSDYFLFKSIYKYSKKHSFQFLVGTGFKHNEESYEFPQKTLKEQSLTPTIGIGYCGSFDRNSLVFNLRFSTQRQLSSSFKLPLNEKNIIWKQVYIPYLMRSEHNNQIHSDLLYTQTIRKDRKIGVKLSFMYAKRIDAPYVKSLANISAQRNHNVLNFSTKLFLLF